MPVLSAILLLEFLVILMLRLSILTNVKNVLSLKFSSDFVHFLNFEVLLMINDTI